MQGKSERENEKKRVESGDEQQWRGRKEKKIAEQARMNDDNEEDD